MKILKHIEYIILTIIILLYHKISYSLTYTVSQTKNRLIGENFKIIIPKKNILPLEYFAEKFQIGLSNLLEANPNIDVYLPESSRTIIIPHQLILPDTPHEGIIINSAEMRLFFYPKNSKKVIIFPIGIGEIGKNTPLNWITTVYNKKKILVGHQPKIYMMNILREEKLYQK